MTVSLLHAILRHGDALDAALADGDFDAAVEHAAERQQLVEQLLQQPRPESLPTAWEDVRAALAEQSQRLNARVAAQEEAFTNAFSQVSRHRHAQRTYDATPPSSSGARLRTVHG